MPEYGLDSSWHESAACRGTDPELFFPVGVTGPAVAQIRAAKAVCGRCPVRERCLAYALDNGQTAGVWAGQDENERLSLRRRQRRRERLGSTTAGPRP
jgi:WhiB family transcriptional regulator, redox-sensing transcriptional regulator